MEDGQVWGMSSLLKCPILQQQVECSGIVLQCEKDIKIHFLILIYQHIYIDFISL